MEKKKDEKMCIQVGGKSNIGSSRMAAKCAKCPHVKLSHKVSDLKSHIIHGESSQNKDFRMIGPLSMRTNG